MTFVEQLEGRRFFSLTSEVLDASGVDPALVGDIHNTLQPYWMQRNNRGLDIFNPIETAKLVEATAIDGNGAPHGAVLAVGIEHPDGEIHVVATGNALT